MLSFLLGIYWCLWNLEEKTAPELDRLQHWCSDVRSSDAGEKIQRDFHIFAGKAKKRPDLPEMVGPTRGRFSRLGSARYNY